MKDLLTLRNITKVYNAGSPNEVKVLKGLDLTLKLGDFTAIMGASGSGKSTLMNIVGILDTPTDGEYILNGDNVEDLTEKEQSLIRRNNISFVFQGYNLLKQMKAWEQVALPLSYMNTPRKEQYERSVHALTTVGLGDKINNRPSELSGGQKQRVAIARALVTNGDLILADEPTGALDTKTGQEVMELLQKINKEQHKTILLITHDDYVAQHAKNIITMSDGVFISSS